MVVCLFVLDSHLVSPCEFHIISKCAVAHDISKNQSVIFLLVACSFLRNITTMTTTAVAAAHKRTKEPGGTMIAIGPILMACILMVHILLMPMASTGMGSEVTTIL